MQIPDVSQVPPLLGPFEVFDIPSNAPRSLTVSKWQLGSMWIKPRDSRPPRQVVALRVWVSTEDKPLYPDYYDMTAQTLVPQIVPLLEASPGKPVRLTITKFGEGPTGRFMVMRHPSQP
jgi:hypothetical protein